MKKFLAKSTLGLITMIVFLVMAINGTLKFLEGSDADYFWE